jgi:hypothetical protein
MRIFRVGNKSLYGVLLYAIWMSEKMGASSRSEEIRWQVIKAMLDEFPTLKEKVKKYLKEQRK